MAEHFPGKAPRGRRCPDARFLARQAMADHSETRIQTGWPDPTTAYNYLEWAGGPTLRCCAGKVAGEAGQDPSAASCADAWPQYDGARITGLVGTAAHPDVRADETLQLATYGFGIYRHWPLVCPAGGGGPGWLNDWSSLTSAIGSCASYEVEGISVLRFAMPATTLGNASLSPDEARNYGIDGASGLLPVGQCEQSAPAYAEIMVDFVSRRG